MSGMLSQVALRLPWAIIVPSLRADMRNLPSLREDMRDLPSLREDLRVHFQLQLGMELLPDCVS